MLLNVLLVLLKSACFVFESRMTRFITKNNDVFSLPVRNLQLVKKHTSLSHLDWNFLTGTEIQLTFNAIR